jgi:hypothetical protein
MRGVVGAAGVAAARSKVSRFRGRNRPPSVAANVVPARRGGLREDRDDKKKK